MRERKAPAAIKMGSSQTRPVPRTRGTRQGGPASTILFNLVLDDASEVHTKRHTEKQLGRIMLKGDNITLIQAKDA